MKVVKNYLYNVAYQVLLLLTPLLTVPYIGRVLGAHGVGVNEYTNANVSYFVLLGTIGIALYGNREVAYVRDSKAQLSKVFWEIVALQIITVASATIIFVLIVAKFSQTFGLYYYLQGILIVAAAFDISWFFMGLEDFQKTVARNMIIKIISIFLTFTLVKKPDDLWKYILILSGSQLFGNLSLWPYLRDQVHFVNPLKLRPFRRLLPAITLFLPTIATQIYLSLNRTMLGRMSSATQAGYFGYSDKLIKIIIAVVTASGTVMLPNIANKFMKGDVAGIRKSLYRSFDFVSALSIPLMFGIAAVAPTFSGWFFGPDFASTYKVIMLEAPAILFIAWSNVTGTQYLVPVNRVKEYTLSVTIGAVTNVALNFVFIPHLAAEGAALATSLSEFVVTFVQIHAIANTIRRKELFSNMWKYLVSGLAMFGVVYRLNAVMHMSIMNLLLQVIVGILVYFSVIVVTKAPILEQIQYLRRRK